MSQNLDRRQLLLGGAASLAGLTVPGVRAAAQESTQEAAPSGGEVVRLHANYIIQPGLISRVEPGDRITTSAPWAVPESYADSIASLQRPVVPRMAGLSNWVNAPEDSREAFSFGEALTLDDAIRLPILGGLPMTNLLGDALGAMSDGKRISLSLSFDSPGRLPSRGLDMSSGLPAVVTKPMPAVRPGDAGDEETLNEKVTIKVPFSKWQFTIKGPERHDFGSCVREQVSHFNLHIQRAIPNRPGRYEDIKNFHLGTYRSGSQRCFVLYNNVKPGIVCWKKCSPKSSDLKEMLAWSLLVAVAIVGVSVSAATVGTMAATAAAAFFPVLIVL